MAVLELLSCQCKRRYQLPNCMFLSNGLQCTDLRRLQDCANHHEDPMEVISETDDETDKTVPIGMTTQRRLLPRLMTTMIRHINIKKKRNKHDLSQAEQILYSKIVV